MREAKCLSGTVEIQGSKNTVLPVIAATLLSAGVSVIENCPLIEDVRVMCELLECLHVKTSLADHTLTIDTTHAEPAPLPYALTSRLRSSVLLLGPMLARWKKARIGAPGGCAIGLRPIDIHLAGMMKMQVDFRTEKEMILADAYYLQGCEYHLPFPSVGATENLILAAAGAVGRTILRGVAKEPEIIELCGYLRSMGVLIEGEGTDVLIVKGCGKPEARDYRNVYDRIVAGTYILLAAAVPSDVCMVGVDDPGYLKNVIRVAGKLGVRFVADGGRLRVRSDGMMTGGHFQTGVYPDFPTDLQPVLVAVLLKANGGSSVTETIFENRFSIVQELLKLDAGVSMREREIMIRGGDAPVGHTVRATDLRQGAALLVAGLCSKGYTTVTNVEYIERGYEDIVGDLRKLGAEVAYI